jgi:hypothetical protein
LKGGYPILAFKAPLSVFMQNELLLLKAAYIMPIFMPFLLEDKKRQG